MIRVLKSFKTRLQRFAAGDHVAETADLSPHTVEGLMEGGFLNSPAAAKPAKSKPAGADQSRASE
ncbi:hypothetical protein NKH17_12405 [Mesorhizobium sp. M1334]|uniref:hypothetical protein n=1 Tax=Mesorhizobium sp. M1334 TaxID=2957084 RepID=UPI00333A57FA